MDNLRDQYPVLVMCSALEVSPSGYYAWRGRPESLRSRVDRQLKSKIRSIFEKSRQTYGSPRIHDELQDEGIRCGRKRVARLMREERLRPKKARRFRRTTVVSESHPKAPNVLDRQFHVESPDMAWAGDITYLWTTEGWLYLAVLLDLYSRRVVGWAVSTSLQQDLVAAALERALFERDPDPGLIHHSDRGGQYTSTSYRDRLREKKLVVSMSRKGNCWDNAVVESFFATLKTELGDSFSTRKAARAALFDYIEIFYNRQRRHTSLGGMSPVEAEARFEIATAA
jgi:transposase InsO family protein